MPRMKEIAASLLLACVAAAQAPQERPPQELEPLPSALTYHTPAYHVRLREVLLRKAGGDDLQFLVLESFEPEVLLAVNRTEKGWQAEVIVPEKQIWELVSREEQEHKARTADPPCKVTRKPLPEALATRLLALWQTMLQRTRYAQPDLSLDGVSYVFLTNGYRGGEASNPKAGTRPFQLAEIGKLTVAWVRCEQAQEPAALQQLTVKIETLEAMLAAADAPTTTAPKEETGSKK
jgi:hypothetical protein